MTEHNSHLNILIIDDDKEVIDILASHIDTSIESQLHFARNGAKAINILKDNIIDIALIDIHLPDINGFELLDRIQIQTPNTIPIIISGSSNEEFLLTALRKRAFDFIKKPFSKKQLIKQILRASKEIQLKHQYFKNNYYPLLQTSNAGICFINKDRNIIHSNKKFQKMLNLSDSSLKNTTCCSIWKCKRKNLNSCCLEEIFNGQATVEFKHIIETNNKVQEYLCLYLPYKNMHGKIIGVIASYINIKDDKYIYTQLENSDHKICKSELEKKDSLILTLLKQIEKEKLDVQENIFCNIEQYVKPLIKALKNSTYQNTDQAKYLKKILILEEAVNNVNQKSY